jgi:asparagine synthetase B (glutamine-hydrolysing)
VISRDLAPNAARPLLIGASAVRDLERELLASLHMKVADIPTYTSNYTLSDSDRSAVRVAVLFSGGLDCTLLARLTNDLLPVEESIDLPNVALQPTHCQR